MACAHTGSTRSETPEPAPSAEVAPPASTETCAEATVVSFSIGAIEVPEATEEEVLAYVSAHPEMVDAAIAESPERFMDLAEERRSRHVMVSVDADATAREIAAAERTAAALLRRIRRGEDFAEVARAESADPSSAPSGGDLGWHPRGVFVTEVDDAVFGAAAVGLLPTLIRTVFGFHIIEVTAILPARAQASMEEMRTTLGPEIVAFARRSVIVEDLFLRAIAEARARGVPLDTVLSAELGEDAQVLAQNHGPFRADEAPRALSPDLRQAPEDMLARVTALSPGEVFGPILSSHTARAFERLPDAPCVPRFVVRGPPHPDDPFASTSNQVLDIAHGLGWAHSDCYRRHALAGEQPYGTLEMGALVDETGAGFSVFSDGLSNRALSHCVLSSFDRALRMTSDEGRVTLTFEISFLPPE